MKNWIPLFIPVFLTLFSCNSSSGPVIQTADTLQPLLGSLRDSIRKNPDDLSLRYYLVSVLQEAGRYSEALQVLDSTNITSGDSTELRLFVNYLFKKSELLEQAGDTPNAIRTLEQFVIPGELTQAGLRLANLYAETNNPKTIPICQAMIKNDPEGLAPEPNYIKGIYFFNSGNFNQAITEFDSSIRKDYQFIEAHLEKGISLFKLNRYEEARQVFDRAIAVSNSFADAYFWKGKCEEAMGEKEKAKLNYLRAYGLDKTLAEAKAAADKLSGQ